MTTTRSLVVASLVASLGALGGCVGVATWPPIEGQLAINDPNTTPMNEVMAASLRRVAELYPPPPSAGSADFAISLPTGIKPHVYQGIVSLVSPRATPIREGNTLPVYHVAEIRVRGSSAQVTVFRPVFDPADLWYAPTGVELGDKPVYQEVTVSLQGGFQPWHVTHVREWHTFNEPPAPNFWTPAGQSRLAGEDPGRSD